MRRMVSGMLEETVFKGIEELCNEVFVIQHLTEQVACDCYIIKDVRRLAIEHFFNRS